MNTKLKLTKLLNDTKKNNEPIKKVSDMGLTLVDYNIPCKQNKKERGEI